MSVGMSGASGWVPSRRAETRAAICESRSIAREKGRGQAWEELIAASERRGKELHDLPPPRHPPRLILAPRFLAPSSETPATPFSTLPLPSPPLRTTHDSHFQGKAS